MKKRPALLDVNVLIALFDETHVHHLVAHDWFADHRNRGWATCPLTENGFLRVLTHPRAGVVDDYARLLEHHQHPLAPRHLGTQAPRHPGTSAPRHLGTWHRGSASGRAWAAGSG